MRKFIAAFLILGFVAAAFAANHVEDPALIRIRK